jgi:hypothetical protein
MKKSAFWFVFLALLLILPGTQAFGAEKSAAEFYKGKTVQYVIPYGVGGGTDRLSRMMIPYLEKRLGCKIVPANKAGAGGLIGLNYVWNAKKKGLVMGTVMYDAAVFGEFVKSNAVKFEIDKLNLIGGIEKQALILNATKNGPFKTFEDVISSSRPPRMALPGKMSTMHVMMAIAQDVWDFKIDFIPGYKGAADRPTHSIPDSGEAGIFPGHSRHAGYPCEKPGRKGAFYLGHMDLSLLQGPGHAARRSRGSCRLCPAGIDRYAQGSRPGRGREKERRPLCLHATRGI